MLWGYGELCSLVGTPSITRHSHCHLLLMAAGDLEAKRRGGQKNVLERVALPTFDICVEMLSPREWTIWEDVGVVVDMILLGKEPPAQVGATVAALIVVPTNPTFSYTVAALNIGPR
jgi:hypothetical protein